MSTERCRNGHDRAPQNTYTYPDGQTRCVLCRRAEQHRRRPAAGPPNALKTHCKHGHEFTPENTCLYRGKRICKQCRYLRHWHWMNGTAFTGTKETR
jgi:hypothetical protein